MDYVIIKLCCFDCRTFYKVYFTDKNYYEFITFLKDYEQYVYKVYNTMGVFITDISGLDLIEFKENIGG